MGVSPVKVLRSDAIRWWNALRTQLPVLQRSQGHLLADTVRASCMVFQFLVRTGGSDSSRGRESDVTEGGNNWVFGKSRGEEHDDEPLVVSNGGNSRRYHMKRMQAVLRQKGGQHKRINIPVEMAPAAGADRENHA